MGASCRSFLFSLSIVLLYGANAYAQKVNFDVGAYMISADPKTASSTPIKLSTFGSYSISANFELKPPVELGVGYTLFFSKGVSGDMGFGPDFAFYYFPLNEGSGIKLETPMIGYREIQSFRPFGYAAFHQRQFQSVQSSYSGFGFGFGAEWQWSEKTAIRTTVRTMSLVGPNSGTFSLTEALIGLQLQF